MPKLTVEGPDLADKLNQMAAEAGCSRLDLVNSAYAFLECVVQCLKKGETIASIDERGNDEVSMVVYPITMPFFKNVKHCT